MTQDTQNKIYEALEDLAITVGDGFAESDDLLGREILRQILQIKRVIEQDAITAACRDSKPVAAYLSNCLSVFDHESLPL